MKREAKEIECLYFSTVHVFNGDGNEGFWRKFIRCFCARDSVT